MGLNDIVMKEARPLPVILLVDNSGSMANDKIDTVNVALKEMMSTFKDLENTKGKIQIAMFTFGNKVELAQSLEKVENITMPWLTASGKTWMGEAINKAVDLLEDKSIVPERAYTPTIILLSDGIPSDCPGIMNSQNYDFVTWEPLKRLHESERLKKCPKLALGIGKDANYRMLKSFINNENIPVIKASELTTITKFFKWVTNTVSKRSVSANPNAIEYDDFKERFGEEEWFF